MVFHYTNFVVETNAWWLKRVRPAWVSIVGLYLGAVFYRYYYYHVIQARYARDIPEEDQIIAAEINKRQWGYGQYYEPTLERSMKKKLYEELGDNYKPGKHSSQFCMVEDRPIEQIYKEETDEFEL